MPACLGMIVYANYLRYHHPSHSLDDVNPVANNKKKNPQEQYAVN